MPPLPSAPNGLPPLLSVPEVAAWLRTSKKAVYAMVDRGQLAGVVRVGRRILFDRAALIHWLDKRRAVSPEE